MHTPSFSMLKRRMLTLVLAISALWGGSVAAQDLNVGWNPRSGDVWVDTWLGDMNRYGARYPEPFIDEMVRYHNAPRPLVLELLETRHWAPGDVYYACALASVLGRPCRHVVDIYEADRGQGWGVVAQRLGIKPGSRDFHQLKKGFVPTYDRWARPIDLDADLRRDFPNHGKDRAPGKPKGAAANSRGSGKPTKSGSGPAAGKGHGPAHDGGGQGKGQGGKKKGHGKG